jgi:soluble lytic murein transglycosylase-like protein
VLEEVAAWVLGRPISKGFRAFSENDVVAAVRKRRRSFELFRSYGEEATRWELVRRLPYGELIHSAARRYEIDGLLLASIVEAESGFDPLAVSPRGALGLMQIMPTTAEIYSAEELMEPSANIDLGARYLVTLLDEFDGDLALALAAYNAGPGNVRRFGGVPPFRETRRYVDSVLTRYVSHQRDVWQSSGSPALLF